MDEYINSIRQKTTLTNFLKCMHVHQQDIFSTKFMNNEEIIFGDFQKSEIIVQPKTYDK